jgi:CysZ protein
MRELARGASDVTKGIAVLREHPDLWKWLLAPAALSLTILVALIALIVHFIDPVVGSIVGHLPHVLATLAGSLLTVLVVALMATGGLLVFVALAGVVSGPFNEMLSERIEARLRGHVVPPFVLRQFVREAALGVAHGIRRLVVAVIATLLVFALGMVPGVGTLAALVLGFWFASRATAYDCYDAVLARRGMAYRAKLDYLADHRARTFGLGATVTAMLFIPGLNLIALGLGAAGATTAMIDD